MYVELSFLMLPNMSLSPISTNWIMLHFLCQSVLVILLAHRYKAYTIFYNPSSETFAGL